MINKQIVRVEHTDGIGMFTGDDRSHTVDYICPEIYTRHAKFKTPREEGLKREKDEFCAYKSIDHIQQWIMKDEFHILFENNYKVYLIEVSNFREGKDNVLFKKQDIINKTDISQLFL